MIVVRIVARNLHHTGIFKIKDPDGRSLAAMIALPGLLPFGMRNVGNVRAVRRETGVLCDRERQGRGKSAFDGHGVKLIFKVHEAVGPGIEDYFLAVRSPSCDIVIGRIIGEAAGNSSSGSNNLDIAVALVFASEGDL